MGRRLLASMVTGAVALVVGAGFVPTVTQAAPAPVPTTVTLPLFGAPLTIDITTGPGGNLATVAVNPADALTVVKNRPNKVAFVNEDGTAKIVVKGHDGNQKVQARAGTLADVSGPGSWSGDVFGTGTATTVNFVVGELAGSPGAPDITGVTTTDPTAEIGSVSHKSSDEGASASVKIKFVSGDQARFLSIKVRIENEDDDDEDESHSHARISISLSKLRGLPQPVADAVGPQRWDGTLCDGSDASITYVIGEDGSISDVVATPAAVKMNNEGNKIRITFAEGQRVTIRVRLKDGNVRIQVDEKFRCGVTPVVTGAATTTTEVDDDDDDEHESKEHDDDDHDGRRGKHKRGGDDGVPTTTETTEAPEPTETTVTTLG
jgi:hypothetical protein